MPLAFFGTFFRFERKYWTPSGRQPHRPRRSRRVSPPRQEICACGRTKGLSSGQTIGAVRTAVRSACCLPELRVANRLRRLYPLDTRFPSFPFGNLRAPKLARKPWNGGPTVRTVVGASIPRRESSYSKVGFQRCLHIAFLGANNRRDAPLGVCLPTKRRPIRLQAPNPAPQPHGVDFLIARRLPSS